MPEKKHKKGSKCCDCKYADMQRAFVWVGSVKLAKPRCTAPLPKLKKLLPKSVRVECLPLDEVDPKAPCPLWKAR
jgi:hypothetical protein